MNADFLALFQSSLAEVTSLLGTCFTFNGQNYTGIANDVEVMSTLLDGGQLEGLATIIIVEIAQMPVPPVVGQTLRLNGNALRVEKIKSDEISHELFCVSAAN